MYYVSESSGNLRVDIGTPANKADAEIVLKNLKRAVESRRVSKAVLKRRHGQLEPHTETVETTGFPFYNACPGGDQFGRLDNQSTAARGKRKINTCGKLNEHGFGQNSV